MYAIATVVLASFLSDRSRTDSGVSATAPLTVRTAHAAVNVSKD